MSDSELSRNDPIEAALAPTTARVLAGRAGLAYRTATWLKLREDHAAARDAVHAEVDLMRDFGHDRIDRFQLFSTRTRAATRAEFLRRPDLGRKLDDGSAEIVRNLCPARCQLQIAIGDGLSATAVAAQAPGLLDRLLAAAQSRGWSFGRPFLIHHCRVGVLNHIGELLEPEVVVLLIGERPGLATAESLSAYMAFRPRSGHTDADRNLISNIHGAGVSLDDAARRIIGLADRFRTCGRSGVGVTESISPAPELEPAPQAPARARE